MDPDVRCNNCGRAYPETGAPYRCQSCEGLYDYSSLRLLDPALINRSQPGIWRYRHTFSLPPDSEPVSLGEGNTPLVWVNIFGRRVALKCEYINPSGSFKDRGSSVIVSLLKSRGITNAIEDSSGNAGASYAAYAARAGMKAQIYIPECASGPKRRQITAYGAELITIAGSRSDVANAVMKKANEGLAYASHAYLPFNIPGYATTAYEIYEQLDEKMPGSVVLPVGQGGFLLGLAYGFKNLRIATHKYKHSPKMIGVQASGCAPLWELLSKGETGSGSNPPIKTLAEGVNVQNPVRASSLIKVVRASNGTIMQVEEEDILAGREALARMGFYVEPTSAIVWPALKETIQDLPDPIVILLTGSGLKYE
jgi:threonine synthase